MVRPVRVPDVNLQELRTDGFTVLPGFLNDDELQTAQMSLWEQFPRPEDFFADPDSHRDLACSQFAGLRNFPFVGWDLNRIAFHSDLVDAIERYLGSTELMLYKAELWAKYSGAIDYDQAHHRDFGNHSLVVPRADGEGAQITSFILLSEVTDLDGPTKVVRLQDSADVPFVPEVDSKQHSFALPKGSFADVERPILGPAGTLFMYRTDVLHRGTNFGAPGRSRFALLTDFTARGRPWLGKIAWPNQAISRHWVETMERATVRERDLFGFPKPDDPYWDEQTLDGVQRRYPEMDMTPYGADARLPICLQNNEDVDTTHRGSSGH